ncbi:ZNF48 protein, partial [Agelaius phoeniceus]|nr:ZNF48 protein [Agelaius phoeniceus]
HPALTTPSGHSPATPDSARSSKACPRGRGRPEPRPGVANRCGQSFGQRSDLAKHLHSGQRSDHGTGERPFGCGLCGKRRDAERGLLR